jgi:exodeoxyribonuclease VIII
MSYDEIKALNWSTLKHIAVSPKLYRYRLENPEPKKADFLIGNAVHCAVLEPDKFSSRYATCGVRRDARTQAYQGWQDANGGAEALKPAEMMAVEKMVSALRCHGVASGLLSGGRAEESTTWTDPTTGILCKGRLDYTKPSELVDLKTTKEVDPRWFVRQAATYRYHGQLAFYHYGAMAAGKIPKDAPPPWIVSVQKTEPYDVCCFQLDPFTLQAGRDLCLKLMQRLTECIEADMWPGAAPDPLTLELPKFAVDEIYGPSEEDEIL